MLAGSGEALEEDAVAGRMLAIIRADNPLGDFGLYKGVVEIAFGYEGFTPTIDAEPASGAAGSNTILPTAILTTYIDDQAPQEQVLAAIDELAAAHPWEVPVIELLSTRLIARSGAEREKVALSHSVP